MAAHGEIRAWLLLRTKYIIRIMKEQIFEKIKNALVCYNIANQNVNEAYDVLISSNPSVFNMLSRFYRLNEEEENFAWSAGIA